MGSGWRVGLDVVAIEGIAERWTVGCKKIRPPRCAPARSRTPSLPRCRLRTGQVPLLSISNRGSCSAARH